MLKKTAGILYLLIRAHTRHTFRNFAVCSHNPLSSASQQISASGACITACDTMVLGITSALCGLLGFVYPTYASFKAIESYDTSDDKQWLTFWVVIGAIELAEAWVGFLLFWFPFYYELKFLVLLWLIAPQTHGAFKLYEHVIKPFLVKHASKVDPVFNSAQTVLKLPVTGSIAKMVESQGPVAINNLTNVVFNSSAGARLAKMAQSDPANLERVLDSAGR